MKKIITSIMLALCATVSQAATGDSEAHAVSISVGGEKTVKLVEDSIFSYGVYYLKVTLKKGKTYTIWFQGGDAEKIGLDGFYVFPKEDESSWGGDWGDWGDDDWDDDDDDWGGGDWTVSADAPMLWDFRKQGSICAAWLYSDDWESSAPSSWTYYIKLSSETLGLSTTVHVEEGERTFLPAGMYDNPKLLTMTDAEQTFPTEADKSDNVTTTAESNYWFIAKLDAGRRYLIRTTGGTAQLPLKLGILDDPVLEWGDDPDYAADVNNGALEVYPGDSVACRFVVSTTATNKPFGLVYQAVPMRTPAAHNPAELTTDAPQQFRPGRLCADKAYYDRIIDEHLFRITANANERWVFDAKGADRKVEMRLYDATGAILASNDDIGDGTHDVRVTYDIAKAGDYFVGVFDPELKQTDPVVCSQVSLAAKVVEPEEDDVAAAVGLSPLPGTVESDPVKDGAASDAYTLTAARQSRTFVIGGRKGLVYRLGTSFEDETSSLALAADVFTVDSKGKEKSVGGGSLTPGIPLSLTATANESYYIRISVNNETKGLDFPAFRVHSVAYTTGSEQLGILTVNIKGPDSATWSLDKESVKYPGGASVLLAGSHTVKFNSVNDFTTPASQTATVEPGIVPTVLTGVYNDKSDPADDYVSGSATIGGKKVTYKPVSWSLKNTDSSYDRTLWTSDVADIFAIDGKDGNFYDFALSKVTGDAVFSITNATPYNGNNGIFALGETSVSKLVLPACKTKYYLIVSHGNETPTDGVYRVTGKFATVGAIKFGSVSVKAKEDAASVKLTVKRTAKDGRVRVRYATVAGTAQPGTDYYAQSGILEWLDKDSKDKTIEIRLIPDLTPTYEGGDRQFTVKLEPIPEDERADDEYEAAFTVDSKTGATLDTATVTLTETAKAAPGTIQVADSATPKKPVYSVRAGTGAKITIPFARTVGTDGVVGVKVETVKGKALPDVDYVAKTEQLIWNEGESDVKTVTVDLLMSSDLTASKAFTLKLTALTSKKGDEVQYAKPTLAASTVTINVLNDRFAETVANFAKALPSAGGVAIKEGKTGTWFVMDDGSLKNLGTAGKLTFTLTGPGVFKYTVDGVEYTKEIKSVGKTETVVIEGDGETVVTYEYLYNGGKYTTILQAVKYGYGTAIADETATGLKVSAGKLPDGLKLEQDKGTTKQPGTMKWFVRGVPTKAGYYYAEIQDKDKASVTNLAFCVREAGTAIGTFNGILEEDGAALTNGFPSVGTVQLTVTSAGKLSAKVTLAGANYSFSGTGFDTVDKPTADNRKLTAAFELTKKIGTVTYTNVLSVTVYDAALTNLTLLGTVSNRVELTMAIPDTNNKGAQDGIRYAADLYRDNTKSAEYLAAFAAVEGYYTAALPIQNPEWGKPQGNGYLTFTVDTKGKCKTAGKLADGTSVSCSLVPALIGDLADPDSCELVVPVYQAMKPAVFGGLVRIAPADCGDAGLVPVVDSTKSLRWASDDATKTYDGTGWNYELAPSGGWYDKVVNLQAYYLSSAFELDAGSSDDLPEELLTKGYSFVSSTMPTGEAVTLAGDTPTVAKQSLVKATDPETGKTTSLYDWEKCVNPSGVTISFKRATGIISGKFDVWTEGEDAKGNAAQKKISGFKHEGVLLLARDAYAPIAEEVWTAGYFLTPNVKSPETGKSFAESYQFNIIREDLGDVDWWDGDQGWNPAWGEKPTE